MKTPTLSRAGAAYLCGEGDDVILVKGSYRTAINGVNPGLVKSDIRSRGYVLIRSPDPREQPTINPRYLAEDTDRRAPAVSSTNTNAPTIMIAEKGAAMVTAAARQSAGGVKNRIIRRR